MDVLDPALGAEPIAGPLPAKPLRLLALHLAVEAVGREGFTHFAAALDTIELMLADVRAGYRSMDDVRRIVRALSRQ